MRKQRRVVRQSMRRSAFRLPGFGGTAFILRSVIVPDADTGMPIRACDMGLLCREFHATYLARPLTSAAPVQLARFFRLAACESDPQESVSPWHDPTGGLHLSVTSSQGDRVGIAVRIATDLSVPDPQHLGLEFETSRSALAQAALDVRRLDCIDADPDDRPEPPAEWSLA